MKVVVYVYKLDEICVGVEIGIDNFEYIGFIIVLGYLQDVLDMLVECIVIGIFDGLLFWILIMEGLFIYFDLVVNLEEFDDVCWKCGLKDDIIVDIKQLIVKLGYFNYMQFILFRIFII